MAEGERTKARSRTKQKVNLRNISEDFASTLEIISLALCFAVFFAFPLCDVCFCLFIFIMLRALPLLSSSLVLFGLALRILCALFLYRRP
jgi:hypothetical protein